MLLEHGNGTFRFDLSSIFKKANAGLNFDTTFDLWYELIHNRLKLPVRVNIELNLIDLLINQDHKQHELQIKMPFVLIESFNALNDPLEMYLLNLYNKKKRNNINNTNHTLSCTIKVKRGMLEEHLKLIKQITYDDLELLSILMIQGVDSVYNEFIVNNNDFRKHYPPKRVRVFLECMGAKDRYLEKIWIWKKNEISISTSSSSSS